MNKKAPIYLVNDQVFQKRTLDRMLRVGNIEAFEVMTVVEVSLVENLSQMVIHFIIREAVEEKLKRKKERDGGT